MFRLFARPLLLLSLAWSPSVLAGQATADAVLQRMLATEDVDIVHAEALPDGVIDILFGVAANELEIDRVVSQLQAHDAVRDVIVRTSPRTFCFSE